MGLHVHLTAQLHHIDPRAWQKAYDESLCLLQRFPAPLIRFEVCEIGEYRRYQTTEKVVCDLGTEKERWEVCGDQASGCRAERFCLYRHLQHHLLTPHVHPQDVSEPSVDVLWAENQAISYPEDAGIELFGNKTQGYPYHLAVLAVGILFENRFPERCFVHGQLDRESAKQTLSWVNAVLDTDFKLPICLDGRRLYARLSGLFQDQQHLIERFNDLFLGSQQEAMRTLVACTEPEELQHYMVAELGHCESLSQLRAIWMLSAYLEAVQSVNSLIDLVRSTPKFQMEPAATLETLLKQLCHRSITIDPAERESLSVLNAPEEQLTSIDDALDGERSVSLPGERYLINQLERYQEKTKIELPEMIAEALGAAVGEVLRTQDDRINAVHPDHYQKLIVMAGQQNCIVLSREAWDVIDLERDLDLVKMLAVLMLITEREANFCKWRTHVLEHKWLWPHLIKGAE